MFNPSLLKSSIPLFIIGWYILSAMLGGYNKWLFGKSGHQLSIPLLVTSFHSIIHFVLSTLVLYVSGRNIVFNPYKSSHHLYRLTNPLPKHATSSQLDLEFAAPTSTDEVTPVSPTTPVSPALTRPFRVALKVIPCGIATALDIGMSNASLRSLSLSFYTLIKGSTPMWSLFFALLIGVEKPSLRLFIVLGSIFVGLWLSVQHSDDSVFDWVGFYLATLASIMGGLRMILIQIILQSKDMQLDNPFTTNMVLSPIMFVTLVPFSIFLEPLSTMSSTTFFDTLPHAFNTLGLMFVGGIMAFTMICTEYRAVQLTSGLTISVAGIFKEILTILVGIIVFGDVFTFMNVVGLMICLSGIALYNYHKWQQLSDPPPPLVPSPGHQAYSLKDFDAPVDPLSNDVLFENHASLPNSDLLFLHDSASDADQSDSSLSHATTTSNPTTLPRRLSRSHRNTASPNFILPVSPKSRSRSPPKG